MALAQFLGTLDLFKRLTADERKRLAEASREKRYAKGETVFRAGETADSVCIVREGRVHLMKFLPSGQASTTCVMANQDTFCCLPALDGKPYPVDAIAAVDSVVVRIPTRSFHEMMQRNPKFLEGTLSHFCERLRQVEERSCMSFDPVERRLAQVLLSLSKKFGATIPLTKHELAEMANTTVETTIRVLSQMKKDGVISSVRGSTTVDDAEALKQLAST